LLLSGRLQSHLQFWVSVQIVSNQFRHHPLQRGLQISQICHFFRRGAASLSLALAAHPRERAVQVLKRLRAQWAPPDRPLAQQMAHAVARSPKPAVQEAWPWESECDDAWEGLLSPWTERTQLLRRGLGEALPMPSMG